MRKIIFAFAILAISSLQASQAPSFQHKTSITWTKSEGKPTEYLAKFKIDKIEADKAAPVEYSAPEVVCLEGQEAVVSNKSENGSYMVKVLIYKSDKKTKAKTVILIFENNENVFTSIEDFDLIA